MKSGFPAITEPLRDRDHFLMTSQLCRPPISGRDIRVDEFAVVDQLLVFRDKGQAIHQAGLAVPALAEARDADAVGKISDSGPAPQTGGEY